MRDALKALALAIPSIRKIHEERNRFSNLLDLADKKISQLEEEAATLESKISSLASLKAFIDGFESTDFPVYLNLGAPSFARTEVKGLPRTIVLTIPKSGTYLVSAYLKQVGLTDTGIHLDDLGFTDYRDRPISEMISNYREFRKIYPLDRAVKMLRDGQFAVGHIGFTEKSIYDLSNINIIFVSRELRLSLISMMRWLSRPGRGELSQWKEIEDHRHKLVAFLLDCGQNLIAWFSAIAGWRTFPGVQAIQFEQLQHIDSRAGLALEVAKKCGISLSIQDAQEAINSVLLQPTKTWSGKHSKIEDFWSDEAEKIFISIGGVELNSRLGYEK
jgi:hypothetical protein